MFKKISPCQVIMVVAVAVVIFLLFRQTRTSTYSVENKMGATTTDAAPVESGAGCEMKAGTGLASSLLPREVASQEDFGEFAPEDILAGQNFLDPRDQIGIPETTGGALRNANQQIRAEPPNSKEAFVWNNSTIAPDSMQRPLN